MGAPLEHITSFAPDFRVANAVNALIDAVNALQNSGAGGAITLTAGTDLAAGTAVSVNADGEAVQTFGPAPQFGSTVTAAAAPYGGALVSDFGLLKLSADAFVAFMDDAGDGAGAISGVISGGAIDLGTFLADDLFDGVVQSGGVNSNGLPTGAAAALSASTFVTAFPGPSSGVVQVRAGSISGGVIDMGGPEQVDGGGVLADKSMISVAALSATLFILAYPTADGSEVVAGTVSGTTVDLGDPVTFASTAGPTLAALDATRAVVVYPDIANSDFETAVIASVATRTVSLGTPAATSTPGVTFAQNGIANMSGPAPLILDDAHFAVSWASGVASSFDQYVAAASVSGTSITWGAPLKVASPSGFTGALAQAISIAALDSTHVVTGSGFNAVQTTILSLSGETLAFESSALLSGFTRGPYPPDWLNGIAVIGSSFIGSTALGNLFEGDVGGDASASIAYPGAQGLIIAPVDGAQALAAFVDVGGDVALQLVEFEPISASAPVGCTASAVASGNPASIVPVGLCDGFSGLSPGATYYANGDGTVTTNNTGNRIGRALTASHLAVNANG